MKINTFFLRVSASCNLDCDYCYVFKHRDMSWRNMPPIISTETVALFADRLSEYIEETDTREINIIYHGGEPLMCGSKKLIDFTDLIIEKIGINAKLSFSMQTNGTLLSEEFLCACEKRNIGISLSIDGHRELHNKHRQYKNGRGSFDDVIAGIELLKKHSSIFEGVIGVIDPTFEPENVLSFFDTLGIENVDLLLPDSTYIDLPIGRNENPNLYKNWLIKAFDSWFFKHPTIQLRTFEHILTGLMGNSSSLDAFGLGSLDYLTIETDGSYHTSDILKVAYENASSIGFGLKEGAIQTALKHEKVKEYNELLKYDTLPKKCKECVFSVLCGGGSLPHRYAPSTGFNNPSVYCDEMYVLIEHAIKVLQNAVDEET